MVGMEEKQVNLPEIMEMDRKWERMQKPVKDSQRIQAAIKICPERQETDRLTARMTGKPAEALTILQELTKVENPVMVVKKTELVQKKAKMTKRVSGDFPRGLQAR
jgi:hypothetical protein